MKHKNTKQELQSTVLKIDIESQTSENLSKQFNPLSCMHPIYYVTLLNARRFHLTREERMIKY
jgi:hypothetical protein